MTALRKPWPWLALAALVASPLVRAAESGDELAQLLAQPVYGSSRFAGASKYDQDLAETPSLVYVRTGGEIRAQGYRTLAEVLDSLPGINLRYDRTYTYTGVRGISRPGDYSSRLLLLIDGVRVNDAIYDSATAGNEFPIDIGLIDRVEYIPGPGSSLYGSNAVLGVVNVITRGAAQLAGLNALVEDGSGANRKLALTWGGDLGPARVVLGAASQRARGRDSLYFPAFDDPSTNHGVAERRDGERSDKLFAKARWNDLTFTSEVSTRRKTDPTAAYGAIFNTDSYSTDSYALADLAYARKFGSDHEVYARVGVAGYDYDGLALYDTSGITVPGATRSRARWASTELRYVWSGLAGHRILFGAEYQDNFRQALWSADLDPAPQVYTDLRLASTRASLFVNDEWQVLPTVRLNLGLRGDRRLDHRQTLTPRLAALWAPSPEWTFRFQRGSAFREPNVSELHYTDGTQLTNAALTVESLHSNELSALWRPSAGLDITAAVYSLDIGNSISLVTRPDGQQQYVNIGRLRSRGIELEATQVYANGIQARASVSAQRGIDRDTGAALSDSPRTLVKLMLTAPGPWAGARVGVNAERVGTRLTLAGAELPASIRVNGQLTYAPAGRPWSLALALYNLTGRRYADPGGPEHREDALPQDGRSWRIQLGWTY